MSKQDHQPPSSEGSLAEQSEEIVRGIYRGFLGREPEPAGLRYWCNMIQATGDPGKVLNSITQSDEFRRIGAFKSKHKTQKRLLAAQAQAIFQQRPLTIVDVGAKELAGQVHAYASIFEHQLPHQVIGFEPLEDKLNLSSLRNQAQHATCFPILIGDGKQHTFHINNVEATSSLLPFNRELIADLVDLSPLQTIRTETVATSTLDQALCGLGYIDFLKLDIQGFELTALQHAQQVLGRTNVVHCEVSFAEIYQGQALFSEVELLMRDQGFYFLDFSSTCHYPCHCASNSLSRDRLGWADAVFLKTPDLLLSPLDLLAQSLIALFFYDKYSIAENLMERYDQANGSAFAKLFAPEAASS